MYLLDTDSVSYALRGHGQVATRIREHKPSEIRISAITLAELRYGADRKGSKRLHRLIDGFVSDVEAVPFDAAAAAEYGRISALLIKRGSQIGQFDVLIAAHAIALGYTLVSNNVRLFSRVTGLTIENWTDESSAG
jgi:tRNA(fMet)-specific endonuclease VapC